MQLCLQLFVSPPKWQNLASSCVELNIWLKEYRCYYKQIYQYQPHNNWSINIFSWFSYFIVRLYTKGLYKRPELRKLPYLTTLFSGIFRNKLTTNFYKCMWLFQCFIAIVKVEKEIFDSFIEILASHLNINPWVQRQ